MVRSPLLHLAVAIGSAALALVVSPTIARAHRNGVSAEGCEGCHNGGKVPTVTVTASPDPLSPGQMAIVTVAIQAVNGPVGGLYIHPSKGTMTVIANEGTRLEGQGIVHSAPKQAVNGFVTFHVGWTAPSTPGGVDFYVSAVSANNDGSNRGDGGNEGFLTMTYGCTGTTFYRDFDGDGFGGDLSGYTKDCTKPMYFADKAGDCNDNDAKIYPGAPEICDKRDNNCNGQIDEGLPILTCHVDMDGDGHGVATGAVVMNDCICATGYAANTDDCNDNDATIYPGAMEICDYKDNNCNGQTDEGAVATCGTGWCRRNAAGCNTSACTPGKPRAETCNDFDDDCDGVNDNGTDLQLCGAPGLRCYKGNCISADAAIPPDDASTKDAGASGGGGVTGSGGSPITGGGSNGGGEIDTGAGGAGVVGGARQAPGCAVGGAPRASDLGLLALALVGFVARRRRRY
ncbi:MAG TPA: putative metal-binding motif-containing protein [Polyangia bacterium]|nr:putative metal-binding motif-containing protein [Polyangia bacterium]